MADLISKREEAIEAWAVAVDSAYNPDRYPIMAAMFRDYADAGLDAALAILHPTVPNETNVLKDLPFNSVLRGEGYESAFLVTITPAFSPEVASAYYSSLGVTEWAVLYYPEEV